MRRKRFGRKKSSTISSRTSNASPTENRLDRVDKEEEVLESLTPLEAVEAVETFEPVEAPKTFVDIMPMLASGQQGTIGERLVYDPRIKHSLKDAQHRVSGNEMRLNNLEDEVGNLQPGTFEDVKWAINRISESMQDPWLSIAYDGTKFVALAASGSAAMPSLIGLMTSTDGVSWTEHRFNITGNWASIIYANGKFVAVCSTGHGVITSPDGIVWTKQSSPPGKWVSITGADGYNFVAVGDTQIMHSYDGANWTLSTNPEPSLRLNSVKLIPGAMYIAVGNNNSYNNLNAVLTSTDGGLNWTARAIANTIPTPNATYPFLSGIAYGNNLFVAISSHASRNDNILTSPDGINWTRQILNGASSLHRIIFAMGFLLATSVSADKYFTSTDGINWTEWDWPLDMSMKANLIFADNKIIVIGYGREHEIAVSTDGINWALYNAPRFRID